MFWQSQSLFLNETSETDEPMDPLVASPSAKHQWPTADGRIGMSLRLPLSARLARFAS